MRRHRWRIGGAAIPLAVFLLAVIPACSFDQQHGYAQSSDGSLSFRYPADWHDAGLEPQGAEWVAGIDGSEGGDADPTLTLPSEPYVTAQVRPLRAEVRDEISLGSLRLLALPDQRDPLRSSDRDLTLLFHNQVADDNGFEGHHMRFEIDLGDGTAIREHLAVLDPERQRIQEVTVMCTEACFSVHSTEIDALFDSVRLRP